MPFRAALILALLLAACGGDAEPSSPADAMSGGTGGGGASGGAGGGDTGGMGGTSGVGSGGAGASASGGVGGALSDAGPVGGNDAADDAGNDLPDAAGPFAIPELPYDVEPGEPIAAPGNQWSYVAFPDSLCANGTPTGIAINPTASGSAEGLLVFMQGGGACWDANSCFVTNSSVHLHEEVGETTVLTEAGQLSGLFEHDNVANPFANYAYVYMSYCTGDLHIGSRATEYQTESGPQTIQHHGALNVDAYLKRLVATFPSIERVVVSGISAGGFGSTFNWWRYQGAFPNARVDVLDDAGLLVDAHDDLWQRMVASWQAVLPPGCDACEENTSAFLPFYAQYLVAPRRYALSGYLGDAVIGQYFGLTSEEVETQMLALRAAAAGNQKTFFLSGTQHSVIGEGAFTTAMDGSMYVPWLVQLEGDDPAWDHAGP